MKPLNEYFRSIARRSSHFLDKYINVPEINRLWSGDYKRWEDVLILSSGYDNTLILEKCKSALLKVKNGEAVYERDSVVFNKIQHNWALLAVLQKASLEANGNLCVLDFGGSLGGTFYQNKDFLDALDSLRWCIIEQPHFVKCGKENFEDNELKFYYSLEDCLQENRPNVLLLSSVLQYLEKPYDWLEKFIELDFPYIILDRTAFVEEGDDLLTLQQVPKEIYHASYPAWFFSRTRLEAAFKDKYHIISSFDSGYTQPMQINNRKQVYWDGIILKK